MLTLSLLIMLGKMVCLSFFAKRRANFRRDSLLAAMQTTLILATKSMHVDQDVIEDAKGVEVAVAA